MCSERNPPTFWESRFYAFEPTVKWQDQYQFHLYVSSPRIGVGHKSVFLEGKLTWFESRRADLFLIFVHPSRAAGFSLATLTWLAMHTLQGFIMLCPTSLSDLKQRKVEEWRLHLWSIASSCLVFPALQTPIVDDHVWLWGTFNIA